MVTGKALAHVPGIPSHNRGKDFGEVELVAEAQGVGGLLDAEMLFVEEAKGLVDLLGPDELDGADPQFPLEEAADMLRREMKNPCQIRPCQALPDM